MKNAYPQEVMKKITPWFQGCFMIFKGVPRVFQRCSRKFQENFQGVSKKFHGRGSFKDVSRVFHDFQGCFQSVLRKFQESYQGVSKKFHVAWHSSQLPEQKEGLFRWAPPLYEHLSVC